jgi:RNA polymerase sigma factor (sigma-70 family)
VNTQTDQQLLQDYAGSRSEPAFAELVRRHVDLVYSAALRMVCDSHLAQDVTQSVFIALANNAGQLTRHPVLSGWLHRTTQNLAANAVRTNVRRQTREQEAAAMNELLVHEPDAAWENIAPHLDIALGELSEPDRDALLLRYFERKSAREIAQTLGTSEEAAQKRVNRAVERLREFFLKRNVTIGASGLVVLISANSVQAAPTALATTISAATITKAAAASGSTLTIFKGAIKTMAWTKAKTAIVVGACLLVATGTTMIVVHNAKRPIQGIPKDWSILRGEVAQWNWAGGKIKAHSTNGDSILASSKRYNDVTISAVASTSNRDADIVFRMQDADNGYIVLFVPDGTPWAAENGSHVSLIKRTSGDEVVLASFKRKGLSQSEKISVRAKGALIEVRLNEVLVLEVKDTTFSSGFVGLRISGDPNKPCDATFSNLVVR